MPPSLPFLSRVRARGSFGSRRRSRLRQSSGCGADVLPVHRLQRNLCAALAARARRSHYVQRIRTPLAAARVLPLPSALAAAASLAGYCRDATTRATMWRVCAPRHAQTVRATATCATRLSWARLCSRCRTRAASLAAGVRSSAGLAAYRAASTSTRTGTTSWPGRTRTTTTTPMWAPARGSSPACPTTA